MVTGTSKTKSSLNERSFLDYVPHEMLAEIKGKMKTRTFPAGTIIFREGDPGDAYFSILEGRVRAFRKDEHGLVVDLARALRVTHEIQIAVNGLFPCFPAVVLVAPASIP